MHFLVCLSCGFLIVGGLCLLSAGGWCSFDFSVIMIAWWFVCLVWYSRVLPSLWALMLCWGRFSGF